MIGPVEMGLLYAGIGAIAGLIAGLFGVGGGLIIVPALLALYGWLGYQSPHLIHVAVGTSLATIMVTSISSIQAHHRNRAVRWDIVRPLALPLMLGAVGGAAIAGHLPHTVLQAVIGCFALWVAWRMYRPLARRETPEQLPSVGQQRLAGWIIGVASAIFGIGGGSLTVPYLSRQGVAMQQAVGTAAAGGLPIAIAGALGFMVFGASSSGAALPAGSVGFVNIPAFLGISLVSMLTAQVGARLAHRLPAATLKRGFSLLLATVGFSFLYKAAHGML